MKKLIFADDLIRKVQSVEESFIDIGDLIEMIDAMPAADPDSGGKPKRSVKRDKAYIRRLWEEFGDVPMNPETECIESGWHGFRAGTHREEIWHWFEETFDVRVHDLMYGECD